MLQARVTDVEDVNAQLQQTIHKLEAEVENLEREKSHLANEVATANSIVSTVLLFFALQTLET